MYKRKGERETEEDKRKWAMWHIRVPEHLDTQLEQYIEKDSFATKAEFVREAVRDRLEEEKKKRDNFLEKEIEK